MQTPKTQHGYIPQTVRENLEAANRDLEMLKARENAGGAVPISPSKSENRPRPANTHKQNMVMANSLRKPESPFATAGDYLGEILQSDPSNETLKRRIGKITDDLVGLKEGSLRNQLEGMLKPIHKQVRQNTIDKGSELLERYEFAISTLKPLATSSDHLLAIHKSDPTNKTLKLRIGKITDDFARLKEGSLRNQLEGMLKPINDQFSQRKIGNSDLLERYETVISTLQPLAMSSDHLLGIHKSDPKNETQNQRIGRITDDLTRLKEAGLQNQLEDMLKPINDQFSQRKIDHSGLLERYETVISTLQNHQQIDVRPAEETRPPEQKQRMEHDAKTIRKAEAELKTGINQFVENLEDALEGGINANLRDVLDKSGNLEEEFQKKSELYSSEIFSLGKKYENALAQMSQIATVYKEGYEKDIGNIFRDIWGKCTEDELYERDNRFDAKCDQLDAFFQGVRKAFPGKVDAGDISVENRQANNQPVSERADGAPVAPASPSTVQSNAQANYQPVSEKVDGAPVAPDSASTVQSDAQLADEMMALLVSLEQTPEGDKAIDGIIESITQDTSTKDIRDALRAAFDDLTKRQASVEQSPTVEPFSVRV